MSVTGCFDGASATKRGEPLGFRDNCHDGTRTMTKDTPAPVRKEAEALAKQDDAWMIAPY